VIYAASSTASAAITNQEPTIGTVTVSPSSIDLTANSTKTIYCSATVTDNNGYSDVSVANATFYDSDAGVAETDSDSYINHYTNTSCSLTGGSGTTITTNCSFAVQYNANASTWTCKIYANDTQSSSANSNTTTTINSLAALEFPSTISFSSLAPGATSSAINRSTWNTGNTQVDTQLSGQNLTYSTYNISVSNVKYATAGWDTGAANSSVTEALASSMTGETVLTTSAATITAFNLGASTVTSGTALAPAKSIYWDLHVPTAASQYLPAGTYEGTATITAVAG
jgi:hypothetical protein